MKLIAILLLLSGCAGISLMTGLAVGAGAVAVGGVVTLEVVHEQSQAINCLAAGAPPALISKIAQEFSAPPPVDITSNANMEVLLQSAGDIVKCVAADLILDWRAEKAQKAASIMDAGALARPDLISARAAEWCAAKNCPTPTSPDAG